MRFQWQIDQGKQCLCGGSDEMCPCQNISPTQRAEIVATSPRVLVTEVRDQLIKLNDEIQIGPEGEGHDWKATIEACTDDLSTVLEKL